VGPKRSGKSIMHYLCLPDRYSQCVCVCVCMGGGIIGVWLHHKSLVAQNWYSKSTHKKHNPTDTPTQCTNWSGLSTERATRNCIPNYTYFIILKRAQAFFCILTFCHNLTCVSRTSKLTFAYKCQLLHSRLWTQARNVAFELWPLTWLLCISTDQLWFHLVF